MWGATSRQGATRMVLAGLCPHQPGNSNLGFLLPGASERTWNLTPGRCAEIRVEDDDIQTPKVPDGLSETSPRSAAGDWSSAGRRLPVRASCTAAASTLGGTLRGSIRRPRPPACGVRERRHVQWSSCMGRLSLLIY